MKRSKLCNDFLKDGNDACQIGNRKQRNLCVTLLQETQTKKILKFRTKIYNNNKRSWKSVKPLFSDKITVKEIINYLTIGKFLAQAQI